MLVEFRGFATNSSKVAIKAYRERTGFEPTALIVRPNSKAIEPCELILETRFGAAGIILITHEKTVEELRDYYAGKEMPKDDAMLKMKTESQIISKPGKEHEKKKGRPKSDKARCPHCQQLIRNFENLGFWHGWERGEFPPYWDELSAYVFKRDDQRCQYCGKKRRVDALVAHHVFPKEQGGTDSARNLTTLCKEPCHEIVHQG